MLSMHKNIYLILLLILHTDFAHQLNVYCAKKWYSFIVFWAFFEKNPKKH